MHSHREAGGAGEAGGTGQSPIALDGAEPADLPPILIDYPPGPCRVTFNGYAFHVQPAPGGVLEFRGERLGLEQFHFHTPAEHVLSGERFPMELHFVHRGADGGLTVLAVFAREGAGHPVLGALEAMAADLGERHAVGELHLDPTSLIPPGRGYLLYDGSLTTLPYTEGVRWIVIPDPIEVSPEQVAGLADHTPFNARDLQPLRGRRVLRRR